MPDLPTPDPVSVQIGTGLARIGDALRSQAWQKASAAGLTPTQARALAQIRAAGDGLALSDLARGLGVSAPTASETVKALVAKKLVRKTQKPDRRSFALMLTEAGQEQAAGADAWPEFLEHAISSLADSDQAGLMRGLSLVIRTLQDKGAIDPQRQCLTCRYFQPYAHDGTDKPHHCGLVDAAFGEPALRIDCAEHSPAPPDLLTETSARYAAAG
tara:strand:+ start:1455 stop:2099 length:645 start_codon:yes stop_codon:yes gene_type:complete